MKALVIGLGSMGKRRVRNLQSLGVTDIVGFDQNKQTAAEAKKLYGIKIAGKLGEVRGGAFGLGVISTIPGQHLPFAKWFAEQNIPFFVELNLITKEALQIEKVAKKYRVPVFFSNTEFFDSDIQEIQKLIHKKSRGYFTFHLGQNINDWHPWQKAGEHFIFKPATNGIREMLRVELPWMLELFGAVQGVCAQSERFETRKYGIDDYVLVEITFTSGMRGVLILDLLTPQVVKCFDVVSAEKRVIWHERHNKIEVQSRGGKSQTVNLRSKQTLRRYKFSEDAHLAEMAHVLKVLKGKEKSLLTFKREIEVLKLIDRIERIKKKI